VLVGAVFGVATVLTAVGFLVVGIATLRAGVWRGWGRFTPLGVGIAACPLVAIGLTHALPTGVAVYGLCLFAFGVALRGQAQEPVSAPIAVGEAA
jgi:hypothetical protein